MKPLTTMLAALAMSASIGGAMAHGGADHSKIKAAHGGQVVEAGAFFLELVVARDATAQRESPVTVHVLDHEGRKVATAGATGTATLLVGKEKVSVPLKAEGDNRIAGAGKYSSDPGMKAIVSVTVGGKTEQARFTPLSPGGK
jgi:hypothetical protein